MKLMRKTLLLMLFLCLTAFTAACGDDGGSADGAELYAQTPSGTACVACHGETGMGDGPLSGSYNPPPTNLTTYTGSAADIESSIRNGVGQMPAYSGLSDAEVEALVNFVISLGS